MGAPDLIFDLRNAGYSIRADGGYLDISPANDFPPDLLQKLKQRKPEILAALQLEQQQEARRENVLALLANNPGTRYAMLADSDSDPLQIILAIAIRDHGTCEMLIPKSTCDPWRLLELIEQHGTQHIH